MSLTTPYQEQLTPRERSVLDAIRKHISDHGYPPTIKDLCTATGLRSPASVHWVLCRLEDKGWITRVPGSPRAIRVVVRVESS